MEKSSRRILVLLMLMLFGAMLAACEAECNHTGGAVTCTEAGICEKCGEAYIDPTGHTEVIDAAVPASCTNDGLTEGKHCSVCGVVFAVQERVNAHGHSYDNESDASCNSCGEIRKIYSEGLSYRLLDDGTYSVIGISTCENTDIIIPKTHDGKAVTSIGNGAFFNCSDLINITIPDSVTHIGQQAFAYCKSLASVKIPDSVTDIYEQTFIYCTSLTSVIIGDGVKEIGNSAFGYCDLLADVIIGDSVTHIGEQAFSKCASLTSIIIPDKVVSIGANAFMDCSGLTSATIGKSVTSIEKYAFLGCKKLTSISFGGTGSEWKAISKGSYWNGNVPATNVICSDGAVAP